MPYLRKNNNPYKGEAKKSLVVILIILFLIFFGQYKKEFLSYRASIITSSINTVAEQTQEKIYSFFYLFASKEQLASENQLLRKELETKEQSLYLLYKNHDLTLKELRKTFGDKIPTGQNKNEIVGFVTSKAPFVPFGYALVALGKKDGVQKGDVVLYNDFIVGQVESVLKENCFVKFFGYKEENRELLVGLSRIAKNGISNGTGAYEIDMPKDFSVKENEPVRLAEFPKYIFGETTLGGTLGNAEKNSSFAKSPVNYLEVPFVKIVIK
jgi:cell shape-determining protein MreC